MAGSIAERTERYLREECTYRKKMDGNVHWESRPSRTKSSSTPWPPSSTRFHDALDALSYALLKKKVNYILDADIRSFFDKLDKSWLIKFVEHRVTDPRILRLIQKWLKAGVMEA